MFSNPNTQYSATLHFPILLGSLREPRYIPSANPFHVPHHDLECIKVQCRDRIESHVEQDKRPLEEGIFRIGFGELLENGMPNKEKE